MQREDGDGCGGGDEGRRAIAFNGWRVIAIDLAG